MSSSSSGNGGDGGRGRDALNLFDNHGLGFLDDAGLQNYRATDMAAKGAVKEHVNASVPYPTSARFIMGNADEIPGFSAKRFDIPRKSAVLASAHMYRRAVQGSHGPAFLEKLEDKDNLFGADDRPERTALIVSGQLFDPPTYPVTRKKTGLADNKDVWSPEINDAWMLGHIHAGHPFELHSEATATNLFSDHEGRPTATGRELLQTKLAGYEQTALKPTNAVRVQPLEFSSRNASMAKTLRIGDTARLPAGAAKTAVMLHSTPSPWTVATLNSRLPIAQHDFTPTPMPDGGGQVMLFDVRNSGTGGRKKGF